MLRLLHLNICAVSAYIWLCFFFHSLNSSSIVLFRALYLRRSRVLVEYYFLIQYRGTIFRLLLSGHVLTTDPSLFSSLLEVSTRGGWLTVISQWAPRTARLLSEPRFPPRRKRSVDGAAATVITCLLCRATTDSIPARASYFK